MAETGFEYYAYGPERAEINALVILLHGYGRNAWYMQKMAEDIGTTMPGAMVVAPHGPQSLDTARIAEGRDHLLHIPEEIRAGDDGLHPLMQRQWFEIEGGRGDLLARLAMISTRINYFIDAQQKMFGLSDARTVIMGFSQGAGTALHAAYTRPSPLAGVVCHSAIVVQAEGDPSLRSRPNTLYIHGDADPEFRPERYAQSFDWLTRYSGGTAERVIVPGLGHTTSRESRSVCAGYIARCLA